MKANIVRHHFLQLLTAAGATLFLMISAAGVAHAQALTFYSEQNLKLLEPVADKLLKQTLPEFKKEWKDAATFTGVASALLFAPDSVYRASWVLEKTLKPIHNALHAGRGLPYIGSTASTVDKGVVSLRRTVDVIKKESDELRKIVPTPNKILLHVILDPIPLTMKMAEAVQFSLPKSVESYRKEVGELMKNPGTTAAERDHNLSERIKQDIQTVKNLDAAYSLLIVDAKSVNHFVKNELEPVMLPIQEGAHELHEFEHKLDPLTKAARQIDDLLNDHIGTKFPYPCPSWKHPSKTCHKKISFSVASILEGEGHIEHMIKDALGKGLYKAAKVFGLSKLVHHFEHEAKKHVEQEARKIAMKAVDEIPGVKTMMAKMDEAEDVLEKIEKFKNIDFRDANHYAQLLAPASTR